MSRNAKPENKGRTFHLSDEFMAQLDAYRTIPGITRSEAIERLISYGCKALSGRATDEARAEGERKAEQRAADAEKYQTQQAQPLEPTDCAGRP